MNPTQAWIDRNPKIANWHETCEALERMEAACPALPYIGCWNFNHRARRLLRHAPHGILTSAEVDMLNRLTRDTDHLHVVVTWMGGVSYPWRNTFTCIQDALDWAQDREPEEVYIDTPPDESTGEHMQHLLV